MDALLARAKRKLEETNGGEQHAGQRSRFVRRGDVEAAKAVAAAAAAAPAATAQPATASDAPAPQPPAVSSSSAETDNSSAADAAMDPADVRRLQARLRALGEPIRLFAELDRALFERLKAAELRAREDAEAARGNRNEMQTLLRAGADADIAAALAGGDDDDDAGGATGAGNARTGGTAGDDGDDSDDEAARGGSSAVAALAALRARKYAEDRPRASFSSDAKFVVFVLKRWLFLWQKQLRARSREEQASVLGRQAAAQQLQARQDLRPLIKEIVSGEVDADIVDKLRDVFALAQEREYVRANEVFLALSIGNAPWPIGVTMVSIHARAGRERISRAAHLLNDEGKRKAIQAVKRLLTFIQEQYPTVPSKMFQL